MYVRQSFENLVNKILCRMQYWLSSSIAPTQMAEFFKVQRLHNWHWIQWPWRIKSGGGNIAQLEIRKRSYLRLPDPDLSIAICSHLFLNTRDATLLWGEIRPSQYTSATLRRALATKIMQVLHANLRTGWLNSAMPRHEAGNWGRSKKRLWRFHVNRICCTNYGSRKDTMPLPPHICKKNYWNEAKGEAAPE